MPRTPRPLAVLTTGLVVLLAAGCAGATPAAPPPIPSGAPVAPSTTPATTSTAPLAAPIAADGTNLDACRDGTCEVRVEGPATVPVPRRTGFLSMRVVRDGPDLGLVWEISRGGGGTATGDVYVHIAEGTTAKLTPTGDGASILRIYPE